MVYKELCTHGFRRMWVIAWRPFSPTGMFVSKIGDLNKQENAVVCKHGLIHAMGFKTRGEAQMLLNSIKEMQGHNYWKEWVFVNLDDHYFEEVAY